MSKIAAWTCHVHKDNWLDRCCAWAYPVITEEEVDEIMNDDSPVPPMPDPLDVLERFIQREKERGS